MQTQHQQQQQQAAMPEAARFGGFLVSAPECLEGQPGLQCDMFSLGLMLWDMCIGRHACQSRAASTCEERNTEAAFDRNDRLKYSHMFRHCVSREHRAENEAKRVPFWLCPRCSHIEQLKATLSQQPELYKFIVECLHPDPQQRITPRDASHRLSGTHTPFTKDDPDREISLPEAVEVVQFTLQQHDGDDATAFPKSLQEKSSRKFACLNLCDIARPMSLRCKWLSLLLKHMTDGQARTAGGAVVASGKYQRTRELLVEFGLAHAIALFAEDVMSQAGSARASDLVHWQTTLVDVIDFILQAGEENPEQDFYCAVSIILPSILRFLCATASRVSDPAFSSRATDIVCDAFRLVSVGGSRTQQVMERMELQQTLDDMQRSAKPARLLGWLYGHQRCIDLLTLLCSLASTLLQPPVWDLRDLGMMDAAIARFQTLLHTPPPPADSLLATASTLPESSWPPAVQLQLQRLEQLMQCVHVVLRVVKNRINDETRPITADKDAALIAARTACDLPENSCILFKIYHSLQLPRQSSKQLKRLSDLVLANCSDILYVKSGAVGIRDHIIGSAQDEAAVGGVQANTDCFGLLVSLVEVAHKFFNSTFQSTKLNPPIPPGFIQMCKLLIDDSHTERTRASILSANGTDAHLLCVLVSILELMKEMNAASKAPVSSAALLHHLVNKQWNSSKRLKEQDVDLLQAFLKQLYAVKPSVKKSVKPPKMRSPQVAFNHLKRELEKSVGDANEAMLKCLRLPKSTAVGNATVALAFRKLRDAVTALHSDRPCSVAALSKMALYSLFTLPRMFLGNALEQSPELLGSIKDHDVWGAASMLQRLQDLQNFANLQEIDWCDRFAPVLQLQVLVLSLYSGHDQALLHYRCHVFRLLNDIVVHMLQPKDANAARKFKQLPPELQALYAEAEWRLNLSFTDEDTSKHAAECLVCVNMMCKQLEKKGFAPAEARLLFSSSFDFPVTCCRMLCSCWCLMASRHAPSLLTSLGTNNVDALRCVVQAASGSCVQAKACAADMVVALCKHCVVAHPQGDGDGLQSLLLPLLEDVAHSLLAPSPTASHQLKHLNDFTRALTPPTQLVCPSVNGWYRALVFTCRRICPFISPSGFLCAIS